jgi:molybdopterin-guanine dinucleotide biosynthesis adapter protein
MKVFGIAGYSGAGKTALLEKLLPRFTALGLRVSVIKHAHHNFDFDQPGKDSYRHRQAGAGEVLLTSSARWVLMHELRGAPEPTLDECLNYLSPCDLVLIEGYKEDAIPKLEVYRPANGKPPLWPANPNIVAVASDEPPAAPLPTHLVSLDLNDADAIVGFVLATLNLEGRTHVVV